MRENDSSGWPRAQTLARPLEVFGSDFEVHLSSGLTVTPDTLLREVCGRSLLSVLMDKKYGLRMAFRTLRDNIEEKRKSSSTTKSTVLSAVLNAGPQISKSAIGSDSAVAALAESVHVIGLFKAFSDDRLSDIQTDIGEWRAVCESYRQLNSADPFDVLVYHLERFEGLHRRAMRLHQLGSETDAAELLNPLLKGVVGAWNYLIPVMPRPTCILLDTSLRTLVELERAFRRSDDCARASQTAVLALLEPSRKPLGHWFKELQGALNCQNNLQIETKLASRKVTVRGKPITHDRLKAWASVQPNNVMPLKAMEAVIGAVPDKAKSDYLWSRFLLARGLTFLCDFVRSSTEREGLTWESAQQALAQRYTELYRDASARQEA